MEATIINGIGISERVTVVAWDFGGEGVLVRDSWGVEIPVSFDELIFR